MKNTLAIGVIIMGTLLIISAVKNWSFIVTLQVITGQKPWDTPGGSAGGGGGSTIPGRATANAKDRPGWKDEALEKNADGTWKRDSDGYIVIKPGAVPFDIGQANANRKPSEPEIKVQGQSKTIDPKTLQDNNQTRNQIARF